MTTVAVIDYGMGNIRSVSRALEHAGGDCRVIVTWDPQRILGADHVVFPGVGALRDCMSELHRLELDDVIRECAAHRPFLGICLGLQALMDSSEENGGTSGLGIVAGDAVRFSELAAPDNGEKRKVPHMGWNFVRQTRPHVLWEGIARDSRFYFVHSYHVRPRDAGVVAATTDYGETFVSAIARDNIFAVQFHPEKSQRAGLALLANFIAWDGGA
jgi:imidazole glycerol-phosphate synthase subunit HisH